MELYTIDKNNIEDFPTLVLGEQNGFVLCREGSMTIVMDDKPLTLSPNSLCILPAFIQVQVADCSDDISAFIGMDDYDFVLSAMDDVVNAQNIVFIRFHPTMQLNSEQRQRIELLIDVTLQRYATETALKDKILALLVKTLCYEILEAYVANYRQQTAHQDRKDAIYQDFISLLYKNFHKHRDVNFYAERLCLTPKYFATLIRSCSGKSPSDWIVLFVILEAKRLLATTQMSVKQLADQLQFPTPSFFCHYFKKHTGLSPMEYRRSNQR